MNTGTGPALASVLLLALLVEAIVEAISWGFDQYDKKILPDGTVVEVPITTATRIKRFGAVGLGAVLCGLTGVNAFGLLGVPITLLEEPYANLVGSVLTGVIGGRGANFVHDLTSKLN